MFDKLTLNYEWDGGDFSPSLDNIQQARDSRERETGETITEGFINGMRVKVWPARQRMRIEGSLAKFLYHENITMLTPETTQEAIENLGEALGIDMGKARVSSLEFGLNIVTRQEPWVYLERLGEMSRRERKAYSRDTLYYEHKGREQRDALKIYDKAKEAKQKNNRGMQIPVEWRGKNILRFELALNSRLPRQLGMAKVTASSLYSCEVWQKLSELLLKKYESIIKIRKKGMDTQKIRTPKDAKDGFLSFLGLDGDLTGRIDEYIGLLNANNTFSDRKYYTRTRCALKRDVSKLRFLSSDGLIDELDAAMRISLTNKPGVVTKFW